MLVAANITMQFGAKPLFENVNVKFGEGYRYGLIGANGAGKSTTLRAVSGLIRCASGRVIYDGEEITGLPPHLLVQRGLCHVPEGRMVFANLTVLENLHMGGYRRRHDARFRSDLDYVFGIFPRLRERLQQSAGTLSGGEQQMLAIGRALMGSPRCLMLDEPSLGIAPLLVKTIFQKIAEINRDLGITILLVEQNANLALAASGYGYVLETGSVTLHAPSAELRANPQVREAYLGG